MAQRIKGSAYFNSSGGSQIFIEYGEKAFVTTGTTVEVPTLLNTMTAGFALSEVYAGSVASGGEVAFMDRTIGSGTTTVSRKVSVDSAALYSYVLFGTREGSGPGHRHAFLDVRGSSPIELQWGSQAFDGTTDVATEVPTLLSNVNCVILTNVAVSGNVGASENVLFSDRVVSSQAVTVERKAHTGVADSFNYLLVGGGRATWPQTGTNQNSVTVELETYGSNPVFIEFGVDKWTGSGADDTIEVETGLAACHAAIITPSAFAASAANGENVAICDKTISSGAITVGRAVGTTSNEEFSYMFIGQK